MLLAEVWDNNYIEWWFKYPKKEIEGLSKTMSELYRWLLNEVRELQQLSADINIPMSDKMVNMLMNYESEDLAKLSRASFYYGHWKPLSVNAVYDISKGAYWKASNIIDQFLYERLNISEYANIIISEGMLIVKYSSEEMSMNKTIGLAIEKNLSIYSRTEYSRGQSIEIDEFTKMIEDIIAKIDWRYRDWDLDNAINIDSNEYRDYIEHEKRRIAQKLWQDYADDVDRKIKAITDSGIERDGKLWLIAHDISYENCIYYGFEDTFVFGWRDKISEKDKAKLMEKLKSFPYKWRIK